MIGFQFTIILNEAIFLFYYLIYFVNFPVNFHATSIIYFYII
jgi:hypothetical protein